ncbi:hypothetical protein [Pseudogemmobacter sonorensis]|uniref:hypothetical protein n=1 Tax=Pseudogemmobacter sonorensis TaxID=2989681 RepID=UPI00368ADAA6
MCFRSCSPAGGAPRWVASSGVYDAFSEYVRLGDWTATRSRAERWERAAGAFKRDIDLYDAAEIERDPARHMLQSLGFGWQIGLVAPLPTGDTACFTLERSIAPARIPPRRATS